MAKTERTPAQQVADAALSERARRMHEIVVDPETGRRAFGGPQPGAGRKPKRPLAEKVMEELGKDENQKKIVRALFSGLTSSSRRTRVTTALKIMEFENKEAELQLKEMGIDERTPQDQLIVILAPVLARLEESGVLPDVTVGGDSVRELTERAAGSGEGSAASQ